MKKGDPGPCKGNTLYKWRFEVTTQECSTFVWRGCQGNSQNRFDTEMECLAHCIGGNRKLICGDKSSKILTVLILDTLPPYLMSTPTPNIMNVTNKDVTDVEQNDSENKTTPPTESLELVFKETEKQKPEKEFMFAQDNTFIQIDGDTIKTFQLRLCREISFQFRSRLPHGLLVYHNVKNPDGIELDPYALYVIVEKGQLKVVHVFGKHSTSVRNIFFLSKQEPMLIKFPSKGYRGRRIEP